MKKIIFIFMFFIILFSISGNEKIVDLKFKIDGDSKFYPVDENKKMDYGFYKYKYGNFSKLVTLEDETIEPFYGKVNLDLIEKLSKHNREMIGGAVGIGLDFGLGTPLIILGTLGLYLNLNNYNSSVSANLSIAMNSIILAGGIIDFIFGIISIGLTAYHYYHFTKTKKEIINLLNKEPVSIKTDKIKIRFELNLCVGSN